MIEMELATVSLDARTRAHHGGAGGGCAMVGTELSRVDVASPPVVLASNE